MWAKYWSPHLHIYSNCLPTGVLHNQKVLRLLLHVDGQNGRIVFFGLFPKIGTSQSHNTDPTGSRIMRLRFKMLNKMFSKYGRVDEMQATTTYKICLWKWSQIKKYCLCFARRRRYWAKLEKVAMSEILVVRRPYFLGCLPLRGASPPECLKAYWNANERTRFLYI